MNSFSSIVYAKPPSLAQRRQAALAIAQQCSHLLKQDFGATEVIVFGSLRGDTPWHDGSDLDLAVQGISQRALFEAYRQLEAIVPDWLPFDLVAVEQANERLRDHILQLTPMAENLYLALRLRLEDEVSAIEQTVDTLSTALAEADGVPEIFVTPTLAAYIEDFYSGCERLAQRVAVVLDGGLPSGESWHRQLLTQVSESGGHGRPPLWEKPLLAELEIYRSFRHRVRHLYSLELDGRRVLELAQQVSALFQKIRQAVEKFNHWLTQQSQLGD